MISAIMRAPARQILILYSPLSMLWYNRFWCCCLFVNAPPKFTASVFHKTFYQQTPKRITTPPTNNWTTFPKRTENLIMFSFIYSHLNSFGANKVLFQCALLFLRFFSLCRMFGRINLSKKKKKKWNTIACDISSGLCVYFRKCSI